MKTVPFEKLDAFTTGDSAGNPAGLVSLNRRDAMTSEEMQQLAAELGGLVSEVGYVLPADKADFELRYFSREREVPFCGHATVAILYRLINDNPELYARPELTILTRMGLLPVINRIAQENLVYIHAPRPVWQDTAVSRAGIAEALGLLPDDLDSERPLAQINVGQDILLVPLANKEAHIRCAPDYHRLRGFALANGFEIVAIHTKDTFLATAHLRTRVFAPTFGYLEDPATGSGNAALGYHLLREGEWDGSPLLIEQGPDPDHPNLVHLRTSTDRVLIGGQAVCRIRGDYFLS